MIDWEACLRRLREELPAEEFDAKIAPLQPRRVKGKLNVYAPNRYLGDEVRRKYLQRIAELLGLSGSDVEVKVGSPTEGEPLESDGPKGPKGPGGKGTGPKLDPAHKFDSFAVGDCNQAAYEAAKEFAKGGLDGPFRLLLLIGPVGHGKTHLLHSIGSEILKLHPEAAVKLVRGEYFKAKVVNAIRSKDSEAVQKLVQPYKSAQVLLFDDLKFINISPKAQEEFFAIYAALAEKGGRLVVACDRYPQQIQGLDAGLQSRLVGGASVRIEPLDQPTAVGILRKKAEGKGLSLRKNVAERLAVGLAESNGHEWEARQLVGAVESLEPMAQANGGEVTMELVNKHLLPGPLPLTNRRVSVDRIIRETAEYYGVKPTDIRGKRRYKLVVRARHMAMFLCRELTDQPYAYIAQEFGGRHHTTVKAACDKMAKALRNGPGKARAEHRDLLRKLQEK